MMREDISSCRRLNFHEAVYKRCASAYIPLWVRKYKRLRGIELNYRTNWDYLSMKMMHVFVAAALALTTLSTASFAAETSTGTTTPATQEQVDAAGAKITSLKAQIAEMEATQDIAAKLAQLDALTKQAADLRDSGKNPAELARIEVEIDALNTALAPYKKLLADLAAAEAEYATLIAALPVPNPDTAGGPDGDEGFGGDQNFGTEDGNTQETLENGNQVSGNQAQ